ncbi:MAG: hypothetical protein ACOYNZ_07555 [Rhodoferax sp.]
MNTNRTTHFAGLLGAVLMTVAINGAMLWKFDSVAQEGAVANGGQTPTLATLATLESVNVVARKV